MFGIDKDTIQWAFNYGVAGGMVIISFVFALVVLWRGGKWTGRRLLGEGGMVTRWWRELSETQVRQRQWMDSADARDHLQQESCARHATSVVALTEGMHNLEPLARNVAARSTAHTAAAMEAVRMMRAVIDEEQPQSGEVMKTHLDQIEHILEGP